MSSGIRDFLFSATVVGVGLAGLSVWPAIENGGADALVARVMDAYRKTDARLRPAISALTAPPQDADALTLQPSTGAPEVPSQIEPLRLAAVAPVVPAQCDTPDAPLDAAVIGDRLQLRVFETSALAGVPSADGAAPPPTDIIFERLDLSGTYEVSSAGSISLPAIGHVDVAGRSLPCIESLVSRSAFDRLRTDNTVSAAFAARPPILVRGAVRAPGSHAYSPGLTVERILAQVGAVEMHDPANPVRLATLESRLRELERTRAGLGLERMRLEAAMSGAEVLSTDDGVLRAAETLLDEDRVSSERAALAAEIDAQRLRRSHIDEHLRDLDARIEVAERQFDIAKVHFEYFDERREQQAEFLKSRMITESHLDGTAIKAMQAEQVLLEKQEALLQLQTERHLAVNDAALASAQRQHALSTERRTLAERFDALDSDYQATLAELEILRGEGLQLAVIIERPIGPEDIQTIPALPTTPVRPGDLVTVSPGLGRTEQSVRPEVQEHPFLVRSSYSE